LILKRQKVCPPPRQGLTLIELLVVISITALLPAILMPALSPRQRAIRVACRANPRQLGLVLTEYTSDNRGRFFKGVPEGWWDDWREILRHYSKAGGITCRPLATRARDKGGRGVHCAWSDNEGYYGSYGLNARACDAEPGAIFGDKLYWRMTNVKGSRNIPVFPDCLYTAGRPDSRYVPPGYNGEAPSAPTLKGQMKSFCINRYGNGITNRLFMDRSVKKSDLKS